MKKYLNFFVAVLITALSVSFVSCSKDDEPNNDDLVGTWKDTTYAELGLIHYNQFKADGTCIMVGDLGMGRPDVEYTTWKREGNTLYIDGQVNGKIEKLTSTELILSAMGFSTHFVKVPDSEIDKYLK